MSGIYTARILVDRGYKDVTVYESANVTGGKASTFWHEDVPHSMGACYTTGRYNRVLQMAERYYVKPVKVDTSNRRSDILNWAVSNGYAVNITVARDDIAQAIEKYENITGRLTWKFPISRPSNFEDLNMTFGTFLDIHGIGILRAHTEHSLTRMGYGVTDEIPLFYALQWFTPSHFRLILQEFDAFDYGTLFDRMSRGLNIKLNTYVSSRNDGLLKGCKRVFFATNTVNGSIGDVTFAKHRNRLSLDLSIEKATSENMFQFPHPLTGRNGVSSNIIFKSGVRNDLKGWSPFLRPVSNYSVLTHVYESSMNMNVSEVDNYISSDLYSNSERTKLTRRHWDYFPRFSLHETILGNPWKIWNLQGIKNVYFVGAHAAGFESVENIFNYVDALMTKHKL